MRDFRFCCCMFGLCGLATRHRVVDSVVGLGRCNLHCLAVFRLKNTDAQRLEEEYKRMVDGRPLLALPLALASALSRFVKSTNRPDVLLCGLCCPAPPRRACAALGRARRRGADRGASASGGHRARGRPREYSQSRTLPRLP